MKISKRDWQRYISQLSRVSAKSAARMEEYIGQHGLNDMEQVVRYAYALQERYGKAAASLACRMYDRIAEASGVTVPRAEPAPTADYGEVAAAIRGAARQAPSTVPSVVGRHTKRAAADTTLRNAQRDGAQFAWVPHGDTCPFCLTLAANGWQYMSKKALKNGHAAHIHSGCDCEYCVRFDKDTQVAGYDPDYYRGIYDAAEGDTWREKVNALRREEYAANPEKYREQKRIAYQAKTEREQTKAIVKNRSRLITAPVDTRVWADGTEPPLSIGQSVGAAFEDIPVKLPDGTETRLTPGGKIEKIRTIAGYGRDRGIDDIDRLMIEYPQAKEERLWQKKKGIGSIDYDGESYKAELHWYEHPSTGRVEFKVKIDASGNWFIEEE